MSEIICPTFANPARENAPSSPRKVRRYEPPIFERPPRLIPKATPLAELAGFRRTRNHGADLAQTKQEVERGSDRRVVVDHQHPKVQILGISGHGVLPVGLMDELRSVTSMEPVLEWF